MSNESAKLSNCFLYIAFAFLIFSNSSIVKAQNNSAVCEPGFESRWGFKYVWRYKTNYNTGKLDYVYVNEYVLDCFPIEAGNKRTNSNSRNSVNRSSSPGAANEIRQSDLIGTWEGLYDKITTTLIIERIEGEKFYGMLKRQGTSVEITGTINSNARSINFSPAKIVTMDKTVDWRLGYNWGDFAGDGNSISGKGLGDLTTYEWSFTKKNTSPASEPSTNRLDKPLKPGEFTDFAKPYLISGDAKFQSKNYHGAITDYNQVI